MALYGRLLQQCLARYHSQTRKLRQRLRGRLVGFRPVGHRLSRLYLRTLPWLYSRLPCRLYPGRLRPGKPLRGGWPYQRSPLHPQHSLRHRPPLVLSLSRRHDTGLASQWHGYLPSPQSTQTSAISLALRPPQGVAEQCRPPSRPRERYRRRADGCGCSTRWS